MIIERRKLGKTGLDVGVIGLGTEHLEQKAKVLEGVLRVAVEAGANYVDQLYVESDYWNTLGPLFCSYRDDLVLAVHWGAARGS